MTRNLEPDVAELTIHSLGRAGDGVAKYQGEPIYVPYVCAGEKVKLALTKPKATLLEVVEPAKERQAAPCEHFTQCGGCHLQHLSASAYEAFKRQGIEQMLSQMGVDPVILQPLVMIGQGQRRRAEYKISVRKRQVEIGFFAAGSHELVALNQCPVSDPVLLAPLPALKQLLESWKKPSKVKAIAFTRLENGLDAVVTVSQPLDSKQREPLISYAKANNIIRLNENCEGELTSLYDIQEAYVSFGDVSVNLPVGAFLQATKKAEQVISKCVIKHLQSYERIADLYSGCGTYSFPLSKQAERVSAFEGSAEMVAAMHNAIIKNGLDTKMIATARDLYRRPLKAKELNHYDAVVINPPRNGALPQVKEMGKSEIKKCVMVSCNPNSFKRDALALIKAGFQLTELTPIDQFYWSHHLELVGVFERLSP